MVKVSKENKKTEAELSKDVAVEHKAPQQEKIKTESNNYQEKLNQAREEKEKQQKRRDEETKHNKKKEEPKKAAPPKNVPPEEIFEIPVGKVLSKADLKKRYFELLKM